MKANLVSNVFFLFICFCAFASATVAQEKPQALKFDEFDDVGNKFSSYYNDVSLSQRTERFIKQLKKERGAKVYIIYYQAHIIGDAAGFNNTVNNIIRQIRLETPVKYEDVLMINGGYRKANTIEFWIAPKNAEPPVLTPTFAKSETFVCPNIRIYNDSPINQAEIAAFSVWGYQFEGIDDYSLTWKVSAGEIIEGQGTGKIEVKLTDAGKRVTAYLEVGGLPFPCPRVFSTTAEVNGKLHQIDEFQMLGNGDVKMRMENFSLQLQNNPTAKGYIIVYGGRVEGSRDVARREKQIRNAIAFLRLDASRMTIVRGGFRETVATELWLAFGDAVPVLTPTVDEKFIVAPEPVTKPRPRKK